MWFFRKSVDDALQALNSLKGRPALLQSKASYEGGTNTMNQQIKIACKFVLEHSDKHIEHEHGMRNLAAVASGTNAKLIEVSRALTDKEFEEKLVECLDFLYIFDKELRDFLSKEKKAVDDAEVSEQIDIVLRSDKKIFSRLSGELRQLIELLREETISPDGDKMKKYSLDALKKKFTYLMEGVMPTIKEEIALLGTIMECVDNYFVHIDVAKTNLELINKFPFKALGGEGETARASLTVCSECIHTFIGNLYKFLESQYRFETLNEQMRKAANL